MKNKNFDDIKHKCNHCVCSKCSYIWNTRNNKIPKSCPSCRSTVWMKEYKTVECIRCGRNWGTTSEHPDRCPECGTFHWDEKSEGCECMKCNHTWTPKREYSPRRCPSCRTTTWQNIQISKESIIRISNKSAGYIKQLDNKMKDTIIKLYAEGVPCTKIAICTKVPFSVVYDIIKIEKSKLKHDL